MKFLELLIPPPVVMLITALIMWLLDAFFPAFRFNLISSPIAVIIVGLIGLGISVAGSIAFLRAKTTLNPKKLADTSILVISGIYRFTRNPMYLGILMMLVAWGMFLGNVLSLLWTITFILYMHRYQIRPEEQFLQDKFGDEFVLYKTKVRPWI